uniref:tRNA (cytosine(38)-C(5))-methyltransferase n=1 Tax=Platynereis dumerilii TaxID=6359 RepID=A0A8E7IW08_PLADU|nr:DNMT2 [Platynereis dumerilii]
MEKLRVLELYSGIGGMHFALKECGIPHEVVAAADINNVANDIYKFNFKGTKLLQRTIESLSLKELNKLQMDMITMSPPCQPFTRVGLQKDAGDQRTKSFFHVLDLLPKLDKQPKYILLENVKGFDTSATREVLLETLNEAGYHMQEFLVTPLQFGVPNSRLRYYLLAKRKELAFSFPMSDEIITDLPACAEQFLHQKVKDSDIEDVPDDGRWDLSAFCTCMDQSSSGEICAKCMKLRYVSKKRKTEMDNETEKSRLAAKEEEENDVGPRNLSKDSPNDQSSAKKVDSDSSSPTRNESSSLTKESCADDRINSLHPTKKTDAGDSIDDSCSSVNKSHDLNFQCSRNENDSNSHHGHVSNSDCGSSLSPNNSEELTGAQGGQSHTKMDVGVQSNQSNCAELAQTEGAQKVRTLTPSEIAYVKYRSICRPVSDYLETQPEEYFKDYLVPEKFFKRFWVMDIVKPHARNSCCFTKRYAHHLEGSGSIIQMDLDNSVDLRAYKIERQYNETVAEGVRSMKLRYFTPREISNIMCFPPWFDFPEQFNLIQKYRVLGNSLNVHVVAVLMRLLMLGDDES